MWQGVRGSTDASPTGKTKGVILRAFYSSTGYCKHKAPCDFIIGYENSGHIDYCAKKTCRNDGNEFTKGGLCPQAPSVSNDSLNRSSVALFKSSTISPINWVTRFRTAGNTSVIVPSGAVVGQGVWRMRIINQTAWAAHIDARIAMQANMIETEYWEDELAPASDELLGLIAWDRTTIAAEHSD